MSRLVLGALLVGVWILLWGDARPGNVIAGIAVVALLYVVFPSTRPMAPSTILHPGATVLLLLYVARQLVVSNLLLAREIVSPRARLRTKVVEVPMRTSSGPFLTLITNITALTPGAMTVDASADPPVITLHTIELGTRETATQELHRLEELCVRAFGTAEAVAELRRGPVPDTTDRPGEAAP